MLRNCQPWSNGTRDGPSHVVGGRTARVSLFVASKATQENANFGCTPQWDEGKELEQRAQFGLYSGGGW